jgi:hypothetical protein
MLEKNRFQNPETQATLGTQDTVRRQTKQANSSEQKTEDIRITYSTKKPR